VYFTEIISDVGFTLTATSLFELEILQTSSGSARFVLCDASLTTIAYSAVLTNPASGLVSTAVATFASGTSYNIVAGTRYFIGFLSNQNSPQVLGIASSAYTNQTPYPALRIDNLGSTTPPTTFTGGSESLLRLCIRIKG